MRAVRVRRRKGPEARAESNLIRKSALGGPGLLYYQVDNGKLAFYNLDLGLDDEYKQPADGKSIDLGVNRFTW